MNRCVNCCGHQLQYSNSTDGQAVCHVVRLKSKRQVPRHLLQKLKMKKMKMRNRLAATTRYSTSIHHQRSLSSRSGVHTTAILRPRLSATTAAAKLTQLRLHWHQALSRSSLSTIHLLWDPSAANAAPLRGSSCTMAAPAAVARSAFLGTGVECSFAAHGCCKSTSFRARAAPGQIVMTSNFEKTNPYADELKRTAAFIAAPGKGILASDESNATTGKRLATVGMDNTVENRQAWRELLYSAPGLGNYISGTIMFDETLFQSSRAGVPFVDILKKQGILPGIKVDTGLQPIDGTDGETATQGLDGLADRCQKYYKQGARFAKWRAVLRVDNEVLPSSTAILENAHGLARYAHICQANGLVPIVEPEVTLGEGDYSIERTAYISEKVNSHVFRLLNEYNVILEGILLKPNMILPGLDVPTPAPEEVARYTVRTMLRSVPGAVPGIHFLSGGMSEEEATLNLQALQAFGPTPWSLTFSYGRALQSSTLKMWAGKEENWNAAQERLVALAKANSEAQLGKYKGPHPSPGGERILQALRLGGAGK